MGAEGGGDLGLEIGTKVNHIDTSDYENGRMICFITKCITKKLISKSKDFCCDLYEPDILFKRDWDWSKGK